MADASEVKTATQSRRQSREMDSIHPEPPMAYSAPDQDKEPETRTTQPIHEPGPRRVKLLSKLGDKPEDVDCPYCKAVTRTRVEQVDSDEDGMIRCLICLVCWPMLFCYEGDKSLDHHCSVCGKRLTHRPHGSGVVQVVAESESNDQSGYVASKYGQS